MMHGVTRSATSFRFEVGISSAAEDLLGSRLTSAAVVLKNVDSDGDDVISVITGGDESEVGLGSIGIADIVKTCILQIYVKKPSILQ